MAKKTTAASSKNIDSIVVRMYKLGTGDFFLLKFMKKNSVAFKVMIDCGCIQGNKEDFEDRIKNLKSETGGEIDLLIVTHEHADHINGFEKGAEKFKDITFKKVWFAWTEADEPFANKFRKEHAKMKIALNNAVARLTQLKDRDKYFEKMYGDDVKKNQLLAANKYYLTSLNSLNDLNNNGLGFSLDKIKTMEDILRDMNVIKDGTIVEFYEPGNVIRDLKGAEGIQFLVLGPPKNNDAIKREEIKGEGYEKREKKSTVDMSFQNLMLGNLLGEGEAVEAPFDECEYANGIPESMKAIYDKDYWRKIDNDWLFSAGSLALRHETSINNTSLALAIQFIDSEKILLFPGDAEQGSWLSWHENMEWTFKNKDNKKQKVNAEYILQNTVFYKVSHHLSQNGTPKEKGLEMMKQEDMAAMITLDFEKINSGWLNTMPNDLIGAELIRKTKGKIFFVGDRNKILKNIETHRTSVSKTNITKMHSMNKPFDAKHFIEYEVVS